MTVKVKSFHYVSNTENSLEREEYWDKADSFKVDFSGFLEIRQGDRTIGTYHEGTWTYVEIVE